MAWFLVSFGLLCFITNIATALMVTPDSPCMSLCSDGQGSNSIDGSEIVCQNNDFITTTAGQKLKSCLSCLQLSTAAGNGQNDQHCFTSLQAGCHQQPPDGTIIGLNASVFSQHTITETSPGQSYNTTVTNTTRSKGLSKNSIIGMSIGLGILLLVSLLIIYTLWRKSLSLKHRRARHSSLDERYGALNITAPNEGAFGNPQTRFKTISLAAPPPARKDNNANTTQPFNLSKYPSDDESMHKNETIILPAYQAYYPPSHPHPLSKAEDTVPIMLNDEFSSPHQYPPSSNEATPISNPPRTFSPPAHNPARMSSRSESRSFYDQQNTRSNSIARDIDTDKHVNMNMENDVTISYARAAIVGTQHSGISSASESSPSTQNIQTLSDNNEKGSRIKSPRAGGENRGMREGGREKERETKKKGTKKRMSVINDQDQDQWPGEF
ncbi:hypothetical protein NHQ30_004975 [Ciborinia camelliae]|nr:hypothetical protein NHQ30_004975 [Ciborinia camelliae]